MSSGRWRTFCLALSVLNNRGMTPLKSVAFPFVGIVVGIDLGQYINYSP